MLPNLTTVISANEKAVDKDINAAFIRDSDLWLYQDNKEIQITDTGNVFGPQWSHDGKYILYQKSSQTDQNNRTKNEIWVYHIKTGKQKKVFYDGQNPKWAPHKNLIAFQSDEVLNISDLDRFYNIELGVNSYQWLPDGSGFLLSSQADLLPDGWTSPIIYKKYLTRPLSKVQIHKDIERLLTIPKEIEKGGQSILSIGANHIAFSPSGKWSSIIISPTASWSMDSNMLTLMNRNGSHFEVLDEVILGVGNPKWAPAEDRLAYIAGGGRIVLGFKDKDLKIKEMPVNQSLTPKNYAELDFTWIDNQSLVTSRVEEKEWSNEPREHPLAKLNYIDLKQDQQKTLTNPPEKYGDYKPTYIPSKQTLVWFRGKSLTDTDKNVWLADQKGKNPEIWLENVEDIAIFTP